MDLDDEAASHVQDLLKKRKQELEAQRQAKITNFETFINDRLKVDLHRILMQRDGVYEELAKYLSLRNMITMLKENNENESSPPTIISNQNNSNENVSAMDVDNNNNNKDENASIHNQNNKKNQSSSMESMVNLGHEFFVKAKIPDTSRICVQVGLGFVVEFTHDEALEFLKLKEEQLNTQAERLSKIAGEIKANIKLMLHGISELMKITWRIT